MLGCRFGDAKPLVKVDNLISLDLTTTASGLSLEIKVNTYYYDPGFLFKQLSTSPI